MDELELTTEYFLSPEPYAYLAGIEDDFVRMTELERLAKKGRELGVPTVKKLWNAFKQESGLKDGRRQVTENLANFHYRIDQPLMVGEWNYTADGIVRYAGNGEMDVACPHPIFPSEIARDLDEGTYRTKLAFQKGGIWRETAPIENSILASPRQIVQLADLGISVNSKTAGPLTEYLMDVRDLNEGVIPVTVTTTRMGWVGDGHFIPYTEGIKYGGEPTYRFVYESVHPKGDWQTWVTAVENLMRRSSEARIIIAASFASPLVEIVGALPAFVHLWSARSASGKTVLLQVAGSVWGDAHNGQFVQSMNATAVAMERMAAFYNSLPLILDEMQLTRDWRGNPNFDVYKLSQGQGKGRGTKYGGLEHVSTWRNIFITSGETPLTGQTETAGALARTIEVELKEPIFDLTSGQEMIDVIRDNYGRAGVYYIEHVKELGKETIRERYKQAVKELQRTGDLHEKQLMTAALLLLADEIAHECIFMDDLSKLGVADLQGRLLTKEQTSVAYRAHVLTVDWVAQNISKFNQMDEREQWGTLDRDTGIAYVLSSIYDKFMNQNGFDSRAVRPELAEKGYILTFEEAGEQRYATKVSVNGMRTRCVAVRLEV